MRGEGIKERERGRRKAYTEVRKRRGKRRKEMREGKYGNREVIDGVAKRDETEQTVEEMYNDKRERE